jgi:hypothetical protein
MAEATLVKQMLTSKEKVVEKFIHIFLDTLERENQLAGVPADLAKQLRFEMAFKKVSELSLVLGHRLESLIKYVLNQREADQLVGLYANITASSPSCEESSQAYQECFDAFVDDESSVHFEAGDHSLIGKLSPKNAYILTFFSFLTVRRAKGDNVLQLLMVGKSSTGNCIFK